MNIELRDTPTQARQRIFQHDGTRLAIRLEEIYWAQLDEFAARDGVKLSRLIFDLLDGVDDAANRTAYLRNYCFARLKQTTHAGADAQLNLSAIMEACPIPVFAMTVERKVFAYNVAFRNELAGINNAGGDSDEAPAGRRELKLLFDRPFNQTLKILSGGERQAVSGHIGFSIGDKIVQRRASFCRVEKDQENSPVLVYVWPAPAAARQG